MKYFSIIYALCVLSIPLYAQMNDYAKKLATEIGVPIVCDSMGNPFDKTIIIFDNSFYEMEGTAILELLTKEDSSHVESIKVRFFYRSNYTTSDSNIVEYTHYYGKIQESLQSELEHGYIVYPDSGEWSKRVTRHLFPIRVTVKKMISKKLFKFVRII